MGAGGVIQHQARVLVHAAKESSIYDHMPQANQAKVDAILEKGFADRTHDDVITLYQCIAVVCE